MALTQQERDARASTKRKGAQEEELRLRVRPGTKQALADLMAWNGFTEMGEAMTIMIHRLHELGPKEGAYLLEVPRHEITVKPSVALRLDRDRILKTARIGLLTNDEIETLADMSAGELQ